MDPKKQAQLDQLNKIKGTLGGISDTLGGLSESEKKRFENSDDAKNLQRTLSKGSNTVSKVQQGITTSRDAENRNKAANETINNITNQGDSGDNDPMASLYKRLSTLQNDLAKARESEKAAKEQAAGLDAASALDKVGSAEEAGTDAQTDMSAGVDAIAGRGTTENIEDATIRALADKTSANLAIISNQMQTLGQYRSQFNEYTKQDIDSIARTAERSIQRQIEENQRTTDAMRFAGVLAGRAQFSPVAEQSIIAEVIQDGLDQIEVINEKKNTAIREARKAEAEFNVDVFEQQAELAKEYNNEIESTISAMNARVREVEQDERERIKFRQEQADRNAFILAPELTDATPEQIQAAAAANGIDPGLLAREVQTYKDEQRLTELDIESAEEGLIGQRLSNAINQEELNELRNPANGKDPEEPLTADEVKKWTELLGMQGEGDGQTTIPPTWTRTDVNNFVASYSDAPKEDIPRLVEQYNSIVQIQNGEDVEIRGVMPTDEVVDKVQSTMKDALLSGQRIFGKGSAAGKIADAEGVSKGIRTGGGIFGPGDAETWYESKGKKEIETRAKELADNGYEWYEIVDELAAEYGVAAGMEIDAR